MSSNVKSIITSDGNEYSIRDEDARTSLASKQDTLTAGSGISLNSNLLSLDEDYLKEFISSYVDEVMDASGVSSSSSSTVSTVSSSSSTTDSTDDETSINSSTDSSISVSTSSASDILTAAGIAVMKVTMTVGSSSDCVIESVVSNGSNSGSFETNVLEMFLSPTQVDPLSGNWSINSITFSDSSKIGAFMYNEWKLAEVTIDSAGTDCDAESSDFSVSITDSDANDSNCSDDSYKFSYDSSKTASGDVVSFLFYVLNADKYYFKDAVIDANISSDDSSYTASIAFDISDSEYLDFTSPTLSNITINSYTGFDSEYLGNALAKNFKVFAYNGVYKYLTVEEDLEYSMTSAIAGTGTYTISLKYLTESVDNIKIHVVSYGYLDEPVNGRLYNYGDITNIVDGNLDKEATYYLVEYYSADSYFRASEVDYSDQYMVEGVQSSETNYSVLVKNPNYYDSTYGIIIGGVVISIYYSSNYTLYDLSDKFNFFRPLVNIDSNTLSNNNVSV